MDSKFTKFKSGFLLSFPETVNDGERMKIYCTAIITCSLSTIIVLFSIRALYPHHRFAKAVKGYLMCEQVTRLIHVTILFSFITPAYIFSANLLTSPMNYFVTLVFYCLQGSSVLCQLGLSTNRLFALFFQGLRYEMIAQTATFQICVILSFPIIYSLPLFTPPCLNIVTASSPSIQDLQFGNWCLISFNLTIEQCPLAVWIIAILIDTSICVRLWYRSRFNQATNHKTRAELRLVKYMISNHICSICVAIFAYTFVFLSTSNVLIMLISFRLVLPIHAGLQGLIILYFLKQDVTPRTFQQRSTPSTLVTLPITNRSQISLA